jgi:CRISPR-associated protein Cmr5
MANNIKDLEKERAEYAYECVEKFLVKYAEYKEIDNQIKEQNIKCKESRENELCKKLNELKNYKSSSEYKSYVKKIPSYIQTNGLSATFAFMYSKKGTYEVIYKQIEDWLKQRGFEIKDELIKWIISRNSKDYKLVTKEVMALFLWLRRFAEGMIEKDK